jgi:hypothetical protein
MVPRSYFSPLSLGNATEGLRIQFAKISKHSGVSHNRTSGPTEESNEEEFLWWSATLFEKPVTLAVWSPS